MESLRDQIREIDEKLDSLMLAVSEPPRRYLSIAGAATYCDVSPQSIRRLVASGKLNAYRIVRGKISIDRQELDALVRSSDRTPRKGRGRGREK